MAKSLALDPQKTLPYVYNTNDFGFYGLGLMRYHTYSYDEKDQTDLGKSGISLYSSARV
jgi:hypothetical protein